GKFERGPAPRSRRASQQMTRISRDRFTRIGIDPGENSEEFSAGAAAGQAESPGDGLEEDLADLCRVRDLVRSAATRGGDPLQRGEVALAPQHQNDQLDGLVRVE